MKFAIKTRLWKYTKSIFVIGILSLFFAHGPHGGWIVGLAFALFVGLTLTATIWLLDFTWYWNLVCGLLISTITLAIAIASSKQIQIENNEALSNSIDCAVILVTFIFLIELSNAIGRRIGKRREPQP